MTSLTIEEFENLQAKVKPQTQGLSIEEFEGLGQPEQQQNQGFLKNAFGAVKKAVAGQNEFDLPEIQSLKSEDVGGQNVINKIAFGFVLEPSQEGRVSIIKQAIPYAQFKRDKFDNIIANVGGKDFALNRSGLSPRDFLDIGSEIARFLPASRAASVLTKGASLATKAIGQGSAAVGTELLTKPIAQNLGSNEPVDLGNALIVGGFATAGELALPAIAKLGKAAKKIIAGNKLSNKEKGDLILEGINADDLTEDTIKKIVSETGASPEQRAVIAKTQTLPQEIPLSTGDITRNPRMQLIESEAEKGAFGEDARQLISGFRKKQQEAIGNNIELIKSKFGQKTVETPAEAGAIIQNKLNELKQVKGQAVSDAYNSASNLKAILPKDSFKTIKENSIRSLFKNGVDIEANPEVVRYLNQLDKEQSVIDSLKTAKPKFSNIERLRKRVNAEIIGSNDMRIRRAGKIIKNEIDGTIDDYIEGGLLAGNPKAVDEIKRARALSANFKKTFEDKDKIASLVEIKGFGDRSLKVDADDAINYIFSKNNITKKGVASDIKKLKQILPNEEFGALKQAGFLRLIGDQQGSSFSGAKFSKNLSKAIKDSPEAMSNLYTQEELQLIKNFAQIANKATTKEFGGINTSTTGSANQLLNSIDNIFGSAGRLATGLVRKGGAKAKNITVESELKQAIQGSIPKKPPQSGTGGVIGSITGSQNNN